MLIAHHNGPRVFFLWTTPWIPLRRLPIDEGGEGGKGYRMFLPPWSLGRPTLESTTSHKVWDGHSTINLANPTEEKDV